MPLYDVRCLACGAIRDNLRLRSGEHPLCLVCASPMEYLWRQSAAIETNERFIGGVTIENMGHEPVTVYSREEFDRAMRAHHVEQRIKWVPGDRHLTNWAAGIDAYTLEAATALVSRSSQSARQTDPCRLTSYRGSVRIVKEGEDGAL